MENSGRTPLLPIQNSDIEIHLWKKHYDRTHGFPHRRKLIFFICSMSLGALLYLLIGNSCFINPERVLIIQTNEDLKSVVNQLVKHSESNSRNIVSTYTFSTKASEKTISYEVASSSTITLTSTPNPKISSSVPQLKNFSSLSAIQPTQKSTTIKSTYSTSTPFQKLTTVSISPLEVIGCHLPKLNPFDPTVLEFIDNHPDVVHCEDESHPLVFETDLDSNLIANPRYTKFSLQNCCYRDLFRADNPLLHSEDVIRYKPQCTPITQNVTKIPASHEHIAIFCNNGTERASNFSRNYELVDIFGLTPIKPEVEERIQKLNKSGDEKLSLLVVGLDSLSHMNFIRTMPKTYEYLNSTLAAIGMNGYVKVGDNTFPNLVPVLTGLNVSELEASCWEDPEMELDDCPFIWKTYASQGFRTSFAEDAPWMGTFNYGKRGFNKPPTDYYLRPMLFAQEDEIGHERPLNANLCYGPRLAIDVLLDNIKKLATSMGNGNGNKQYFQWIWSSTFTHDDLNSPRLVDEPILSTLQFLNEGGFLNHTIFVLMSDHGIRWGDIRSTRQGKIEERMPFLYFVFPPWFRQKYQKAISNLMINQDRLTTPFDLYETLIDLISPEVFISNDEIKAREKEIQMKSETPRGISLFLPIPISRTCEMAEIAEHWCVCHSSAPLPTNSSIVASAADSAVRSLNDMLRKYDQCAKLELSRVLNAEILELENQELQSDDNSTIESEPETLSLTFEVLPSLGIFESTLTKSNFEVKWTIVGDISRTNAYGNQSICVTDYSVKKYCYCQIN